MVFRVDETVDGTKDPRTGQMSWVLLENEISLMNYQLELSCIMLPKEGNNNNNANANQMEEPPRLTKEKVVGTWKGLLADLHDKISNTKRKQHFAAQLTSYDLRVGHIEVIFDASEAGEDEHEDALTLMARGSIPVNAGDAKQAWESHGTFYVGIAACGLRLPSPMVRVYSAHGCHECRTYQVNAAGDFIEFADFLPVAVSKYRQKVRIELWSESNFLDAFSIRERLVGEASVYAATPGRREWKHLYGGALLSNYRHHEEQMTRGSLAPSTYRGSLMDPNEEAPSKRTLLRRRARARAAKHRQIRAVQRLCLACRVMIAIRRWRRRTFEVDPYEAFFSTMESMEMKEIEEKKSDAKISEEKSHDDFEIYGESEVYEELLHQFQLRLRGMPLEWPQSKREMVHRALQFAVAEREALSLELIRLRWEVLVVKLLS
eukprot:symbB.v1.2.035149.t1/scaffold4671.1/size36692/2